MASNNTIVLKGKGHHDEGVLGTVASPGMSISFEADGQYDKNTSATAVAIKEGLKIVKEDALQGKTVSDAYAVGDTVFFYEPLPGDHVQLLVLEDEAIAIGDKLVPGLANTGTFIEAGTEATFTAEALEAVTATGGSALVACRIL